MPTNWKVLWEDREAQLNAFFLARLKWEMETRDVGPTELSRRMGGGVSQPNASRWISKKPPKIGPAHFGAALKAVGVEDVPKVFAECVAEARAQGLFDEMIERRDDYTLAAADPKPNEIDESGGDQATEG